MRRIEISKNADSIKNISDKILSLFSEFQSTIQEDLPEDIDDQDKDSTALTAFIMLILTVQYEGDCTNIAPVLINLLGTALYQVADNNKNSSMAYFKIATYMSKITEWYKESMSLFSDEVKDNVKKMMV